MSKPQNVQTFFNCLQNGAGDIARRFTDPGDVWRPVVITVKGEPGRLPAGFGGGELLGTPDLWPEMIREAVGQGGCRVMLCGLVTLARRVDVKEGEEVPEYLVRGGDDRGGPECLTITVTDGRSYWAMYAEVSRGPDGPPRLGAWRDSESIDFAHLGMHEAVAMSRAYPPPGPPGSRPRPADYRLN